MRITTKNRKTTATMTTLKTVVPVCLYFILKNTFLQIVIKKLRTRRDITAETVALLEQCSGDVPAEMRKKKSLPK